MESIGEWWMWIIFFIFITTMLSIDIFLLGGKKAHRISSKEALNWVLVWVTSALIFNLLLWLYLKQTVGSALANQKALEFLTGYLIEESLSIDNIFVFILIFKYFAVPPEYQRCVLIYGVLGAIIMRLIMILLGVFLVVKFHWILYLFGILLIIAGAKMLIFESRPPQLDKNPIIYWIRSWLKMTKTFQKEQFFVRKNNVTYATPLFLVLILIEMSDLIFAIDSIPAIFGITEDPFIVFTSNIFAILGLRSLYFLLVDINDRFHLLKYGIAFILLFIGSKMLIAYWFTIPISISLGVVVLTLTLSICLSLLTSQK